MPLMNASFNSPWNPFDWQETGIPPVPTPPGGAGSSYGLTTYDVSGDPYAGYDAGGNPVAPATLPGSSMMPGDDGGAAVVAAAAASVTPAAVAANAIGGAGTAVSPFLTGTILPPPLRSDGRMTPVLDQMAYDREFGWDRYSDLLFSRFEAGEELVKRIRRRKPRDPAAMPIDGTRINPKGSLLIAPATASGVYTVLTYRVPAGYYGWINYASNEYTGSGFDEAGGGLIWEIQVQNWFYPGYGTIPYSLGSRLAGLWNIAGGLPLLSNQYISYVVRYDTSLGVAPGGRVICTLQGWITPMGEQAR